jgi:hypothetical protein
MNGPSNNQVHAIVVLKVRLVPQYATMMGVVQQADSFVWLATVFGNLV